MAVLAAAVAAARPPTVRRYSSRPNYLSAKRNPSLHTTTALLPTPLIHRIISKNRPTAIRAVAKNHEEKNAAESREIFLSDVVVRSSRRVYWSRRWSYRDVITASVVLSMHVLCLFAPFAFTWPAFWMALSLYLVTGLLGITLSFHRNLSHRSFKLPKWLEYSFAYCGVQALQGSPLDWVSTHRYHHQYCDSDRDPHSPIEGFWYSHMSWIFDTNSVIQRCGEPSNVSDLEKQSFYRFMRSTYMAHPVALAMLMYAVGGFPFVVWGMGVRIVWVYHITWLVNSACHVWGRQSWNTGDLSRNNWWVALLAFGEGWHNNHHAFEYSARHGLEWWQLDFTWYVVWLLQAIGLATDVKVPSQTQKQRMFLNTGTPAM
ncbi:palmitoyl-monogalactosyldiacylglycerol delta-7 desaturase, chloroplastic [Cinnamomum micranthum f. kanehirae]|uniref:Palmitoyl-monogalactosyldiacylglycerol delta-7 desaturase, chloroplastic n=1 Tax=Cinnamomum micranthum f. kanehirae TaxID=337451 RepID=A0A3S3NY18_9MAGN|nr:palmitoyl-monogalactosyldiacylglycerol delta-7 desaturase, chloroplastic [Cinnamomum micranthum f. kanehirae]